MERKQKIRKTKKKAPSLIDYKVLYKVIKDFINKQGSNSCTILDLEEIKENYRLTMSLLFPPENSAWTIAIRWFLNEEIINLVKEHPTIKKKVIPPKGECTYLTIGTTRIPIKDGWVAKFKEEVERRKKLKELKES